MFAIGFLFSQGPIYDDLRKAECRPGPGADAMPHRDDVPRDMLFGLLALQNGMVTRDQLVAAFGAWTTAGGRSMADLLVEQAVLTEPRRALLSALANEHLAAHGNDPEKSLAALELNRSTKVSLLAAGGPPVEATLAKVGSGSGSDSDSDRTTTYAIGTTTAHGQRFRILRPHARGGLGAVFVALDGELHREVALKQILDQHADDPVSRQRFVVEAEITGGLEHPGIVPVYGLGTYDGGRPYYAMRFIKGDSLKEAAERFHTDQSSKKNAGKRSIELRKLLRRFTDVCNAIEYAHSRGILHRDIKPGNVIVGKHGETFVVDWGLAKPLGKAEPGSDADADERTLMPSSASGSTDTLSGSALGTPAYMSPEQAAGQLDRLGPRSDVYSLGATLYCLLTGKAPFEGDVGEMLRKVQRGEFPPPRKLDPTLDRALEAICLNAMALKPEDRYPSCRALAEEIERWTADEPVSAYREPVATRVTRWGRRHRTVAVSTGVLLVAAVLGLSVGAFLINRERAKAEANFRQARAAVDKYFTTVSESKLLDVPGLQPLRKELLESAQEYYRDFLREHGDDPSVRADAASASFRVGWINRALGRSDEALQSLKTAVSLYQKLVRDNPGVAEYHRLAAIGHGSLGLVLSNLGQHDEALQSHRAALAIREVLAKTQPGDVLAQNDVSRTHRNIGDVYRQVGKPDEAFAEWDQALALGRALLQSPAAGDEGRVELSRRSAKPATIVREDMARLLIDRGNVLRERGKHDAAEAAMREARDLFDELLRERPSDQNFRAIGAGVFVNLGSIHVDRGRLEDAEKSFLEGRAIFEQLVAANPNVHDYRSGLAESDMQLGWTLGRLGRTPEAQDALRKAVGLAEGLLADEPDSAPYQNMLARTLTQSGNLLLQAGQAAEALLMLRRALEIQERIARDQPRITSYQQSALASSLRGVGRAEAAAGHPAEARAAFERASTIDRALADTYPVTRYNLACSLALMIPVSDPDRREALAVQAITEIRKACSAGYANVNSLERDPDLESLRQRPDFQALLTKARDETGSGK
jgi:serine/threonine-protein kinase